MSIANRFTLAAGLLLAVAFGASAAPPSEQPMTLELISPLPPANSSNAHPPKGPNTRLPIEFRAGWPLIYRASVKAGNMVGIGKIYGSGDDRYTFPEVGAGGAIVYGDSDGLWSYSDATFYPRDESFSDFYPDVGDLGGAGDDLSQSRYGLSPAEKALLRPEFGGPKMYTVDDGVQYGADDDFPGLVILSNFGVGVVLDRLADGGNPALPRQARNLAGFTNSVGYELSDKLSRTTITSVMIVPRYLFAPTRLVDDCVGTVTDSNEFGPTACSGTPEQRIDGGPIEPLASFPDESLVELRAFVVQPVWNSVSNRLDYLETLVDMNGDGQVTAADAKLAGWKVISNEVVTQFRQIGNAIDNCYRGSRPDASDAYDDNFYADLDGNGYSQLFGPQVCPAGGSGVTQPPR